MAIWAVSAAARGGEVFVTNFNGVLTAAGLGTIGEYTAAGATMNSSLISGLNNPVNIVVSGSNLFVVNEGIFAAGQTYVHNSGTIGEYTIGGATVNPSLIRGMNEPAGIAVSGTNLFVVNVMNGTIGEYTTAGATVNASLITGLNASQSIAISGSNLFVASAGNGRVGNGTISEYTTSGALVNASLITGLNFPDGITVSGANLFVSNAGTSNNSSIVPGTGSIGEYTTSGATINASLITGLNSPDGIAVSGGNLSVVSYFDGTIGEYDAITGAAVNAPLISGLNFPSGIAIVPEPSTWALLTMGLGALLAFRRRR
jgi:hypothetical protein